jgi:hypothetical protein
MGEDGTFGRHDTKTPAHMDLRSWGMPRTRYDGASSGPTAKTHLSRSSLFTAPTVPLYRSRPHGSTPKHACTSSPFPHAHTRPWVRGPMTRGVTCALFRRTRGEGSTALSQPKPITTRPTCLIAVASTPRALRDGAAAASSKILGFGILSLSHIRDSENGPNGRFSTSQNVLLRKILAPARWTGLSRISFDRGRLSLRPLWASWMPCPR